MLSLILFACVPPGGGNNEPSYHVPLLAEQSPTADAQLAQVERVPALAGAAEYDAASLGVMFADAGTDGLAMRVEDPELDTVDDGVSGGLPSDYENVLKGAEAVIVADAVGAVVLGVPAAAVAIALDGTVTEFDDNVWVATNTVSDGTSSVTGTWVVAWVGVGWLAEMRLWSSDGQYTGQPWFNGFLSADQTLGWWDVYDGYGAQTGVVEWFAPDADHAELGIASLAGDNAGDVLGWVHTPDDDSVGFHDASAAEDAWVVAHADLSGEVRLVDYNGGNPACWGADRKDVDCPPEEDPPE